jgi:hypothetical protein
VEQELRRCGYEGGDRRTRALISASDHQNRGCNGHRFESRRAAEWRAFVGPKVKPSYASSTAINHFAVLRLIEDLYDLTPLRSAAMQPGSLTFSTTLFADSFDGP